MNMKRIEKPMAKRSLLVIIVMVVFLSHLSGFSSNAAVNVAVFPFKAEEDAGLSFLKDGILEIVSSRIGLPGRIYVLEESKVKRALENQNAEPNLETARSFGYQLDADYLVVGELSQEGGIVTIKGKIFAAKKVSAPISFMEECSTRDAIIPSVASLAENLRKSIVNLEKEKTLPLGDTPDEEMESLQEERIFSGEAAGKASREEIDFSRPPSSSPPLSSPEPLVDSGAQETGKISLNYWRSNKLSHTLRGVAVGDADGDGNKEIVCITDKRILVYRKEGENLSKVADYEKDDPADFVKIDMLDSNGNGIDEIIVGNREGESLSSRVMEYSNDRFNTIVERDEWIFGVVDFPGEGAALLGQARGKGPTEGEIQRMQWDSEGYASYGTTEIPPGLDLCGLGILGDKNSLGRVFVSINSDGRLFIYDRNGEVQWKSEKLYGGSVIVPRSSSKEPSASGEENAMLPMRLIMKDLNNDQKEDIILGKNFSKDKGLIRRKSVYENSSVYDLQWNGYGMDIRWQTERLDEILVDYGIGDADNDGKDELVLAVRGGRSRLTLRPKSYILIYEIS
jgi:hypothetical protein